MKINTKGKRLLAVVLALAMVLSMFASLNLTAFAAVDSSSFRIANYVRDGSGTSYLNTVTAESYGYEEGIYVDVTAAESFKSPDETKLYTFAGWTDGSPSFYYGDSNYTSWGYTTFPATNSVRHTASYASDLLVGSGTAARTVYGAVYNLSYRAVVNDGDKTLVDTYVSSEGSFTLPYFDGVVPKGKAFAAWIDQNGDLWLEGAEVELYEASSFTPYFVNDEGAFVFFKDYESGAVYDIEYIDPVTQSVIAADAPVKEGYEFEYWYTDLNKYYPGDIIKGLIPATVYYAKWTPKAYSVTTETAGSSYVDLLSSQAVYGTDVHFKVGDNDPNETVTEVTVEGSKFYTFTYDAGTGIYSFKMPAEDVVIKTKVEKETYSIVFLDYDNSIYTSRSVKKGDTLGAAMPADPERFGYEFKGWEVVGEDGGWTLTASTPITSNLFVKADYEGLTYSIVKAEDSAEEIEYLYVTSSAEDKDLMHAITTKVNAKAGDNVVVKVAPKPNYSIEGLAIRDVNTGVFVVAPTLTKISTDGFGNKCYEYGFEMPTNNLEIAAYVVANDYTVSITENVDANGTYRINGFDTTNLPVAQDKTATIDIVPEAGYYVESVTATYLEGYNNIAVPDSVLNYNGDGTYTFTFNMVGADVDVVINYAAIDYNVNVTDSNADTYHPQWNSTTSAFEVVESLDDSVASKGTVTLVNEAGDPIETQEYVTEFTYYWRPDNATYNVGDTVRFKVDTFTGYDLAALVALYADGTKNESLTYKPEDGYFYFTMPANEVTIKAYFVEETYQVSKDSSADAHGEVNINGLKEKIVSADYKEEVTVSVTPVEGYYVKSISYELKQNNKDGNTVIDFNAEEATSSYLGTLLTDVEDTAHEIKFNMPASDVVLTVTYEKIEYSITTKVLSGDTTGTITVESPKTIDDEVKVTVTPTYGYTLDKFYIINKDTNKRISYFTDSINQTYGSEYYFTMPASEVEIYANFVKDAYSVTYIDSDNTVLLIESIPFEETATLTAKPVAAPEGNHFVGWISADTKVPVTSASLDTSDFVINKTTLITAVYEKDKTKVIFKKTVNGYVTNDKLDPKTTATAEQNYVYTYGDIVNLKIVPDEGYVLDEIKVVSKAPDGVSTNFIPVNGSGKDYSFELPAVHKTAIDKVTTDNVVVTVTFKKDNYSLTKAADYSNGTVEINGDVTSDITYNYDYLDMVEIKATPDEGYFVKSIVATMVDNTATSTESVPDSYSYTYTGTKPAVGVDGTVQSITFPMPATDMTYTVVFEKCDYKITTKVVSGASTGTITVATPKQVGDDVDVVVTPAKGYKFVKLVITDEVTGLELKRTTQAIDATYGATYSFVMPADNVKIEATFVKDAYKVTYFDSDGSEILTELVLFEETATLNVTPKVTPEGKHFIGWISADTKVPVTTASLDKTKFVINKETVINAVYATDNTKVIFKKTENGYVTNDQLNPKTTATAEQSYVYKYGDTVELDIVPDPGFELDELTVLGLTAGGVDPESILCEKTADGYKFKVPTIYKETVSETDTADITVTVTFKETTYSLEKKAPYANGSVEINGRVNTDIAYDYDYLDMVEIVATPDKGYYVKSIVAEMVDTTAASTESVSDGYSYTYEGVMPASGVDGEAATITFPMPATNMVYTVVFEKCEYNIESFVRTTTEDGHGTVVTNPANYAQLGDLVNVTIDPDEGYKVKEISVVEKATGNPVTVTFISEGLDYIRDYSFTMPAGDVMVNVTLELAASREYIDVRTDDWYYEAINFVTDRGYFKGYQASEELFGPANNITREEFVLVLARMDGADLTAVDTTGITEKYVDVAADSFYEAAVAWATQEGYITGYLDGSQKFGVGDSILRQDIVTILYRYAQKKGYDTTLDGREDKLMEAYLDVNYIGIYALDAMTWGVDYGVLKGKTPVALAPLDTASRAEVSQMIKNLYDHNIFR